MVLLLETATEVCSVALAEEGRMLAEVTAPEAHQHASRLTTFIQEVLRDAGATVQDLSELVLSDGPGSYTSLRVGAATAKGLCLALPKLRFFVVPTLTALAHAAPTASADHLLATLNSRRGEVYGQVFAADGPRTPLTKVMNVRLADPQWRGKLLDGRGLGRMRVIGPGQDRIREKVPEDNALQYDLPQTCSARTLLLPARLRPALASYEPFYLNPPFVTRSKKKALL